MSLSQKDIRILATSYIWPREKPAISPADWALDGGEKEIVSKRISKDKPFND